MKLWPLLLIIIIASGCEYVIKHQITSDPTGAVIYSGPDAQSLQKRNAVTPQIQSYTDIDAHWKPWCYQVKKKGYWDSKITCKEMGNIGQDRYVHFVLNKKEIISLK